MSSWLGKIVSKVAEKLDLTSDERRVLEQEVEVTFGNNKNTANAADLKKNNGNVPMTGHSNPPPEGEIEGFTFYKSNLGQSTGVPTPLANPNPEAPVNQAQVEAQVVQKAQVIAQQNAQQNEIKGREQAVQNAAQTDASSKQGQLQPEIKNIEYKDGKAIITTKDGKVRTRNAIKGEPGYVKTGESLDERLSRFYGDRYATGTFEERQALAEKYFREYFEESGFSDEKQLNDYLGLIKNTGFEGDEGRILGNIVHTLRMENRTKAYQDAMTRTTTAEQAINYTDGVMDGIGSMKEDSRAQLSMLKTIRHEAEHRGFKEEYAASLADNASAISPKNAMVTNLYIMVLDKDNAQANLSRRIENAGKTGMTGAEVGMITGLAVGTPLSREAADELGEDHVREYETYQEGLSTKEKSILADLVSTATTKVKDVSEQLKVAKRNKEAFSNVKEPEIKEAYLEAEGRNIGAYHEDNQLEVDQMNRDIDTEGQVYNKTVSQYGHTLAEQNQKIFVERTVASGDEESINNVAKNIYGYSDEIRDEMEQILKDAGFESTQEVLDKAKEEYNNQLAEEAKKAAAEEATKAPEEKSQPKVEAEPEKPKAETSSTRTETPAKTTKALTGSVEAFSTAHAKKSEVSLFGTQSKVKQIISDASASTIEKVKEIKTLSVEQQQQAVEQLMQNASILEIKGLMLNGLKSEVINYMFSNFNAENKSMLQQLDYLLSSSEKKELQKLIDESNKKPNERNNFFVGNDNRA